MSIRIITGSSHVGKALEDADQNVLSIVGSVELANEKADTTKGMDFLNTFIRQVEGVQGHTEGFREYKVYATDDGVNSDAETYNEEYKTWTYERRGYIVKDKDFSSELLTEAYENDKDLSKLVQNRMKAIGRFYLKHYIPKRGYETLFDVGEDEAGYYDAPKGFLRNCVVDKAMLKPYAQADTKRMHYWGIEDASAGVSIDDIEEVVEYMSQYKEVSDGNIVAIGTRGTLFKLKNTLGYEGNKDEFARVGLPADEIAGVRFLPNDFMPKGKLLFIAGEAEHLISKLISPKEDLRGLAAVKDDGYDQLNNLDDMTGTYFKVMPEGWHLTGRHYGLILDLDNSGVESDAVPGARAMSSAGFAELANHKALLRGEWYRNLR